MERRRSPPSVPSPGSTAVCPPPREPIAQGLPGSPGPATSAVVRPFAEAAADRVNRRQIERRRIPGRRCALRRRAASAERRAPRRVGPGRAREHLVPRAEAGALAIDPQRQRRGRSRLATGRRSAAISAARSSPSARSTRSRTGVESLSASACVEQPRGCLRRVPAPRRSRTSSDPSSSSSDDVLSRGGLDPQVAPPGLEAIDPGDDRVLVPADRGRRRSAPA